VLWEGRVFVWREGYMREGGGLIWGGGMGKFEDGMEVWGGNNYL
jgi:hypothetical protein